jgi:recombination protein RecA
LPKKIRRFPRLDVAEVSASVIEELNEKYRKDKKHEFILEMLSDSIYSEERPFLKTRVPPLDAILSRGRGFPAGIIEIYGPESSGKTAVTEKAVVEAQKLEWYVLFFCAEYSLNYERCQKLGIDEDKLIMLDAETLEDFFDEVKDVSTGIRKLDGNTPILVIWDSIAATPCKAEQEQTQNFNDNEMAKLARQMSKIFKRMVRFLFKNKILLLAVNQTRSNIGQRFGNPETTTGGRALRFYSWIRLRLAKIKTLRDSRENSIGYMIEARTTKNKTEASPDQRCKFPIYWTHGIDAAGSVWEWCIDQGIFKKVKTHYEYRGKIVRHKTFPKFYASHKKDIIRRIRRSMP